MHHVLMYDFVDDYIERRAQYRDEHLGQAWAAKDNGDLFIAGAFTDPVDGAMLVFTSPEAAEAFAKNDPYVLNGLVKKWRVRGWTTVVGDQASTPVHPSTTKSA